MEEDESKIRRNLVWLSSLIVGWWFVGVDLSEVAKKLIGADKVEHPDRVWFVVAVLLYYVVARFWNTEKATEERKKLCDFRRHIFRERTMGLLSEEIPKIRDGKKLLYIYEFNGPKLPMTMNAEKLTYDGMSISGLDPKCILKNKGTVELVFSFGDTTSTKKYQYTLPYWPLFWLKAWTGFKILFWDGEATYLVFPLVLWVCAVLITMCNLFN